MKKLVHLVFLIALVPLSAFEQPARPDLILHNGKVFTADSAKPYVEALAIRGDRIVATGASDQILALAGPQTKRLDLGGRLVIPGINDAHFHLGVQPPGFLLRFKGQEPTWQEVKDELAAAVAKAPKGTFVFGQTGATVFDDPEATRASLDKLAPDHLVALKSWTGHHSIVNTPALRKLGVKEDEPDPLGGRFVRSGEDGKLTGMALEYASFRLSKRLNDLASEEEALQATRTFLNQAVRLGITSVQNMSATMAPARAVTLFARAPTPIRVRVIPFPLTDRNSRMIQEGRERSPSPSALVTVRGTKWVLDGTPIERSCAMRNPYTDRSNASGWMNFSQKDMEAMLRESLENDDQLLVHIVGDRTTEAFLNAMEATGGKNVWSKRRVRIEHGDGIMPDLVTRVKELGVIVVQNPTHFTLRELLVKRWGLERTEQLQPLRSLRDAGIPVALGSDGPFNPYLNIMLASVYPGKPRQALTREQAVTAYTLTAAYAEFAEKDKGSLEPGKLGDLAVLSQDIFRVPPQDLPKTESLLTMVGGKIVYDAKVLK